MRSSEDRTRARTIPPGMYDRLGVGNPRRSRVALWVDHSKGVRPFHVR